MRPNTTLGELVEIFRHASRNLFPVVAAGGRLLGVVSLDSVRDALFDDAHYATTSVRELMKPAPRHSGPRRRPGAHPDPASTATAPGPCPCARKTGATWASS